MKRQRKLIKKVLHLKQKKVKAVMAESSSVSSTVYQAFNYSMNSEKSEGIRELAITQYGAVVWETYERPATLEDIKNIM